MRRGSIQKRLLRNFARAKGMRCRSNKSFHMSKKLNELTIVEAAKQLRTREILVRELWDACYDAAQAKNPELNAFLEIFEADERAIEAAQNRIDTEKDSAPLLCGIPLAIKD